MTKKISLLIIVLVLIAIAFFIKSSPTTKIDIPNNVSESAKPEQDETSANFFKGKINYQDKEYSFASILTDAKKLHLYPNFTEKLNSEEVKELSSCETLISGGLYTKESTPIGLFISEGKELKSKIRDTFYNGIFSLNYEGYAVISYHEVTSSAYREAKNARIAIQSGPTLLINSAILPFEDRNSEEARRVVLGITDSQKIVFMVFYKGESVFMGPTLSILANLVLAAGTQMGIKIEDALNLDGGSASSIITENLYLSELTPVGSYFCVK